MGVDRQEMAQIAEAFLNVLEDYAPVGAGCFEASGYRGRLIGNRLREVLWTLDGEPRPALEDIQRLEDVREGTAAVTGREGLTTCWGLGCIAMGFRARAESSFGCALGPGLRAGRTEVRANLEWLRKLAARENVTG